jgi:predicted DNA-binding transcriptional regulator AlpA
MTRQQDTHNIPGERLLRIGDVLAMTGVRSRQTIWRKARKGEFPKPIHPFGHDKFAAWTLSSVQEWIAERAKE